MADDDVFEKGMDAGLGQGDKWIDAAHADATHPPPPNVDPAGPPDPADAGALPPLDNAIHPAPDPRPDAATQYKGIKQPGADEFEEFGAAKGCLLGRNTYWLMGFVALLLGATAVAAAFVNGLGDDDSKKTTTTPAAAASTSSSAGSTSKSARLEIFSDQATSFPRPLQGCQPPIGGSLTVAGDGVLTGVCDENISNGLIVKHGELIGRVDTATGSVTFALDTGETLFRDAAHTGQRVTTEHFDGQGTLGPDGSVATGSATYTSKCVPSGEYNECASSKGGYTVNGTVPFKLTIITE